MTSCAIWSRTDRPASRSSTVGAGRTSGRNGSGCGVGGAPLTRRRRRAEPSRSRGAWRAQVSCPAAGCAVRSARVRGAGIDGGAGGPIGARSGPTRDRGAARGQRAPGPRPAGRAGDATSRASMRAVSATWCDLRAAGVRLVALFSPEHGFRGAADPGAAVASSVDSATGLPIYSLYGRTSAPTDEMLAGIDVLAGGSAGRGCALLHLLTTTVDVMKAAAGKGIPVVRARPPESDRRGGAGERARGSAI